MPSNSPLRLVLPGHMERELIERTHRMLAHRSAPVVCDGLARSLFFPSMLRRCHEELDRCPRCLVKTAPSSKGQRHTLVSQQGGFPFQKLSLDFVGPLPTSFPGRYRFILTCKDLFSRWVEAFPTRDMTAATVVKCLANEIFCRFGTPDQLHSDQGTQFTSDLLQSVAQTLGIQATTTPAYNPKSCLLYTSPSPRDGLLSRMPSSA